MSNFEKIYKITEELYNNYMKTCRFNDDLLLSENEFYQNLTEQDSLKILEQLESINEYKYTNSIYESITRNYVHLIIERIRKNIKLKLSNNNTIYYLDKKIIRTFMKLLNAHIIESFNESEEYRKELKKYKKIITFINNKNFETNNKKSNTKEIDEYLYYLISEIIKYINNKTDDEYKNDSIYAESIILQIYLRSIFIYINDKNLISSFEIIKDSQISSSILRTAFAATLTDN